MDQRDQPHGTLKAIMHLSYNRREPARSRTTHIVT